MTGQPRRALTLSDEISSHLLKGSTFTHSQSCDTVLPWYHSGSSTQYGSNFSSSVVGEAVVGAPVPSHQSPPHPEQAPVLEPQKDDDGLQMRQSLAQSSLSSGKKQHGVPQACWSHVSLQAALAEPREPWREQRAAVFSATQEQLKLGLSRYSQWIESLQKAVGIGETDGNDVGSYVGPGEGTGDGTCDGDDVGAEVGKDDGAGVGGTEGAPVGADEGVYVGIGVGTCDGAEVGGTVGISEGAGDGT